MSFDPIVDEVQRIRQEQAARFDYDIEKIYQELNGSSARTPLYSFLSRGAATELVGAEESLRY